MKIAGSIVTGAHFSHATLVASSARLAYDVAMGRDTSGLSEISVVVPVYGCEACLTRLHERLAAVLDELVNGDWELVFVEDRSPDRSWEVLQDIATSDHRVRVCRLSRNFGQHAAITAGLAESRGRWTVVMDCDLQDPPEEIPRLYAKALEGYDIVFSKREERRQPLLRRMAATAYYRTHNRLARSDMHTNYANLSILARKVVDSFLLLRDKDRQYLLILHWLGFRQATIDFKPVDREVGKSAYNFRALMRVALDGIFFQSTLLLRWVVYAGFALAGLGVLLAGYAIVIFAFGRPLPQWTAIPVLILVLTGFIIVSTGVTGLYVGKIFEQVKGRPLYVVDARLVDGEQRAVPVEMEELAAAGTDRVPTSAPETERAPS